MTKINSVSVNINGEPKTIVIGCIYNIQTKDNKNILAMATESSFYDEGWCFEGGNYLDYRIKDVISITDTEENNK